MALRVTALTPCFAAQVDGVDIARAVDDEQRAGHLVEHAAQRERLRFLERLGLVARLGIEDIAALEDLTRCMGEAERNRNDKFFEALLATNVTFRRASGAIVDKETFLAGLRNPANTYETLESRDIAVQRYKGLGVVTLLVQARGMREGKPFEGVFRNVRIFLQEPDNDPLWQLHSWFNVRVP